MFVSTILFLAISICEANEPEDLESSLTHYESANPLAATNQNRSSQKSKSRQKNKTITVPIEIGVGPSAYHLGNVNGTARLAHNSLAISGHAIITKKLIRQNKNLIPKEYRKLAMAQEELRVSKLWIPESIIASSRYATTSALGASFRPVSLSVLKSKKNKGLNADVGARFTYAYLTSSELDLETPHFIGLGVDVKAEYRIPLSKKDSIGVGWASHAYIPQEVLLGATVETLDIGISNWHVGQAFVKYYYRFPYQYKP